ncbi:hypothetical protein [Crossiella cryophila]|uniref:Uncharacterized protein n=1 Tax=Crossiella cryophila TaxID=43355 RepID=A0A7W7C4G3_9PSEU|nr:hypothetical protein [Crossiella cryophila]MBB4674295.1 hypothetical protein [Crossiella cryophila]
MSVEDRLAAALRQQYEATRENELLRDMRESQVAKATASAKEELDQQGKVTDRVTAHITELAKRQRQGGGWATKSVMDRGDGQFRFGGEDEEEGYRPPPAYSAPAPPPPPPPPPVAPPPVTRRAPARRPADDDDDYEQQSWLS